MLTHVARHGRRAGGATASRSNLTLGKAMGRLTKRRIRQLIMGQLT